MNGLEGVAVVHFSFHRDRWMYRVRVDEVDDRGSTWRMADVGDENYTHDSQD